MAIFQSYQPVQASFIYNEYKYRAKVAGTGYALEDVLVQKAKVDEATGLVVSSTWYNVTTGLDITATPPAIANLHAYDGHRILLKSEVLAFDETGAVALAAIPAEADHAEIHVWDETGDPNNLAIITFDGSTPALSNGFRQGNGQTFELESIDELKGLLVISTIGKMSFTVQYFYQSKRNA